MTPEPPIDGSDGLSQIPRPAYDVCNPDRLPAERVVFVDGIHEEFLQLFAQQLTTYLDTPVEATPAGVDQWATAAYLDASATDVCVLAMDLAPMRGHAWLSLGGPLVFRVLDILMGAPQSTAPTVRTNITDIEKHVLREFFQLLLNSLDKAWTAGGISLRLASVGTAEDVRKGADPDGVALVLNCKLKIAESEETFRVAVPVLAVRLASLQKELSAASQVSGEVAERTARLESLSAASLQVEAVLSGSAIRLGDLAEMQAGQILMLSQPAGSQLECTVNGVAKFRGEWIAMGDRNGLQVDAVIDSATAGKR